MLANGDFIVPNNEKDRSYIAIPIDSLQDYKEDGDIQVLQNIFMKQLPDGSICLVESKEDTESNQKELLTLIHTDTETKNVAQQETEIIPVRKRPVIMRVPMKKTKQIESQQVGTRHQKGQNTISKNIAPKLEHKKFKCIKCENMFNTADLYRDHMKWHKCQKKFKCTKCSAGYNIENNLKVHVVLAHPEENNTKCPICNVNLTFQRAASMKSHLMLHQVEEFYTCEECSFEFDKESDFMKHIESHVTEKKFSPKSLTCPHCKVTFEDSKDLRAHISDHVKLKKVFTRTKKSRKLGSRKERNHVCSVCKKSFIKNSLLERHERIHSGIKPFTCQYCGRGFTQKGTLQIHISRHTGVKPHSCTLCPAKFYQKGNLRVHIKKTHTFPSSNQKMYQCLKCTCIFKKIATLNGHMTKLHLNAKDAPVSEEGLIDDIMIKLRALEQQTSGNLKEENPEELKEIKLPQKMTPENGLIEADLVDDGNVLKSNYVHLSESTVDGTVKKHIVRQKKIGDVRWYFCSYCSKQFKKPSDLIRHIRVHTKEKPFKCKHCKTAFSLKSTLISHMKTHKSNQQFTCKVCNNLFASLRLLNSHLRKHDVEALPKWQCITCGFLFSEQEEGLKHREEMGKEKLHIIQPFIDQILKQPLYQTTYGSLVLKPPKQRIPNTGLESPTVRPFHCSLCDARFAKRDNLKRHIQFHNEDRKFKCDLCPKTFITSYRLTEHLNFHNNVKNYTCTVCKKKFVTSSLLKRHLITHNTHKPYQCPYCNKIFKTLLLSRTHIKKVHQKEVIPKINLAPNVLSETPSGDQTKTDFVQNQDVGITIDILQKDNILSQQDLPASSENIGIQQLPTNTPNSVQILNINAADPQQSNDYQTIYINLEEMPFLDGSNLCLNNSTMPSQIKLQNAESLLNQISDLQDNNIIFNIDSLKPNLNIPPADIFSCSNNDTEVPSMTNTLPNIGDISAKTIKTDDISTKDIANKSEHLNLLLSHPSLYPNVTFTDDINIPINVVEDNGIFDASLPTAIFRQTNSSDLEQTENILQSTNIMCINCSRVFLSLEEFQKHSCDFLEEADINNKPKREKDFEKPGETPENVDKQNENNDKDGEDEVQGALECFICNKILPNEISLNRHVVRHSSKSNFECTICNKKIKGKNMYVKHLAAHANSKGGRLSRTCNYCYKEFKKPSDLERHLRTHTGERPFGCHLCDKKFSLKSTLESHVRIHNPLSKQFACNICNSFFSSKASLRVHMSIHTGLKPYKCQFCDERFRTSGNRRSHENAIHLGKSKASKEHKQAKVTDILQSVALEMLNNVNGVDVENLEGDQNMEDQSKDRDADTFPPETINLIPSDNLLANLPDDQTSIDPVALFQQLQMSGVVLTNENGQFILDDIAFLDVGDVKDNVHVVSVPSKEDQNNVDSRRNKTDKNKGVECDICYKVYSSKDVLRKHKKNVHGLNKKFPCAKCEKRFNTQDELGKHVKLHSGYRPFSCLYCANSFTEKQSLRTHMKRIHRDVNIAKETSALLNMKFDLPSATIDDPLLNNLFAKKDNVVLLE